MNARITSDADELAADLRDRRCCDPLFDPCPRCIVSRDMVLVGRRLVLVPEQRRAS